MALIKITGTTNKISGALSRLQTLGKEPQEFLAALDLEMVDRTRQRIDDGVTLEGTPLASLNPLYASGKPSGAPILKRTGSLRNELPRPFRETVLSGVQTAYMRQYISSERSLSR